MRPVTGFAGRFEIMERLYIYHLLASKLHYSHIYLVDGEKHNPGHVARLGAWGD